MPDSRSSRDCFLIEYKNVTVIRNNREVLDNINLSIQQGEHVAILGPNGAGKSSLLKTITREYYPVINNSNSYIRILGEDLWDVFELRSKLGIVCSDILKSSYCDFTCYDTILSGFFSSMGIWNYNEITPDMRMKTESVMDFLGISHLAKRSIEEVSNGEYRLILIGRALVHDPPTLLLDEPTSSLDPRAAYEIRNTLCGIAEQGKSIIMVTHNLSDIIPEIERIVFIKKGQVVCDGFKDKMLNADSLSNLFGIRLEILSRDGYYYSH